MARETTFLDGLTPANLASIGILGLALYIWIKGPQAVAQQAGQALVNAATGAVTGAVGATGSAFGLPAPTQTTEDPYIARWIIDNQNGGRFAASKWASASAFAQALAMDAGTGYPPPANSQLAILFPDTLQAIDFGTPGGF